MSRLPDAKFKVKKCCGHKKTRCSTDKKSAAVLLLTKNACCSQTERGPWHPRAKGVLFMRI